MKRLMTIALGVLVLGLSGCSKVEEPDGTGGSGHAGSGNGGEGGSGSGGDSGEPDCYENPTTHHEIINACTTATRVEKHPDLELLNEDGSLPAP